MKSNTELVDEIRMHKARAHDLEMQLCQRLGDREGMERHKREIYALIEARRAAAHVEVEDPAGCYFDARGHADGLEIAKHA
jgi:hypothetical protein